MHNLIHILIAVFYSSVVSFANIPKDMGLYLQPAATEPMEKIFAMHNVLMIVISVIFLIVIFLILFVIFKFNKKKRESKKLSKKNDNLSLEIVWTLVPTIIVLCLIPYTYNLIYYLDNTPKTEFTIKATGHQWYWTYEYPDHKNIKYDSYMVAESELKDKRLRLLAVDNEMIIPKDTKVKILITSNDVIHSFAVPSFGVQKSAIPGKINETWVEVKREGTYYGQCCQLCGAKHGFMPIAVKVLTKNEFKNWITKKQKKDA